LENDRSSSCFHSHNIVLKADPHVSIVSVVTDVSVVDVARERGVRLCECACKRACGHACACVVDCVLPTSAREAV
jgi:hypothetical protein